MYILDSSKLAKYIFMLECRKFKLLFIATGLETYLNVQ